MFRYENSRFMSSSNVFVSSNRLNARSRVLIFENDGAFRGKRVLDLASHDGRFSHAALACGAAYVRGVEGRPEHVESAHRNLKDLGHDLSRYDMVAGNLVDHLRTVGVGEFDTVLCFGVFSHLIDQVEVMREVRRIAPSHFILDTWVAREKANWYERMRNHRVNAFVDATQLGKAAGRSKVLRWVQGLYSSSTDPAYTTGSLIFLYENPKAAGATIEASGLMAWATPKLVDMLFAHYGFDRQVVRWTEKGVADWTDLEDYRKGDRVSWVASLPAEVQSGSHAAGAG